MKLPEFFCSPPNVGTCREVPAAAVAVARLNEHAIEFVQSRRDFLQVPLRFSGIRRCGREVLVAAVTELPVAREGETLWIYRPLQPG